MPLLLFPTTLLSFVDLPWLRHVADATAPGTMTLLAVQLGAILVFVPLGSWLYWWRFRARLGQPGHRRPWLAAQLWSAALLGGLVLIAHGVSRQGPSALMKGAPLLGLLPLVVILVDLVAEIRSRSKAPGGADLVLLAEYQHPAEAWEDALGRPPEAGVVVQGLRFRTLHYFFAPQVPCRECLLSCEIFNPTNSSNSINPITKRG